MLENIFKGIFDTALTVVITPESFLLAIAISLVIGAFLAVIFAYKSNSTKSFYITLAIIPAIVSVVIMMVNGNIGAGVAVAGAFSLVRFRSAPGTAKEISAIFLAMAAGLLCGMGYLGYAVLFSVILGVVYFICNIITLGRQASGIAKTIRVTIPETLDYNGVFDDIFKEHTNSHDLISVKTTGMGSLYKLTYNVTIKSVTNEKALIDEMRCRNGNLEISSSNQEPNSVEL